MNIDIDIKKAPPEKEAINAERVLLDCAIKKQVASLKLHKKILCIATIALIVSIVGGNLMILPTDKSIPVTVYMMFITVVCFIFALLGKFKALIPVSIAFATMGYLNTTSALEGYSTLGSTLLGFILGSFTIHILKKEECVDESMSQRELLEDTPKDACLLIKDWLHDPLIAAYRDYVVEQGRVFINAEVNVIKIWMAEETLLESNQQIEAAYKDVYLAPKS